MTIQIIIGLIAILVGFKLPDIDLAPLLWRHRSAWTHGPFWAYLLPLVPFPWWGLYIPLGALLGITIHLFADLRPKAWKGSALVNLFPIRRTFSPGMSFLWLLGSCIYSGLTAWRML